MQEGCDFGRFLQIAMGSGGELEYHPLLAHDLGFLNGPDYEGFLKKPLK